VPFNLSAKIKSFPSPTEPLQWLPFVLCIKIISLCSQCPAIIAPTGLFNFILLFFFNLPSSHIEDVFLYDSGIAKFSHSPFRAFWMAVSFLSYLFMWGFLFLVLFWVVLAWKSLSEGLLSTILHKSHTMP
jgi:hypothetical protein